VTDFTEGRFYSECLGQQPNYLVIAELIQISAGVIKQVRRRVK